MWHGGDRVNAKCNRGYLTVARPDGIFESISLYLILCRRCYFICGVGMVCLFLLTGGGSVVDKLLTI